MIYSSKQLEFERLMKAASKKQSSAYWRNDRYRERDFAMSFSSGVKPTLYCMECKTTQCRDYSHHIIELHPILRVPRQTASKHRWKQFEKELRKFSQIRYTPTPKE